MDAKRSRRTERIGYAAFQSLSLSQKLFLGVMLFAPLLWGSNRGIVWMLELLIILGLVLANRKMIFRAFATSRHDFGKHVSVLCGAAIAWFGLLLFRGLPLGLPVWQALNFSDSAFVSDVFGRAFLGSPAISFDQDALLSQYLQFVLYLGVLVFAFAHAGDRVFRGLFYRTVLLSVILSVGIACSSFLMQLLSAQAVAQWSGGFANYNHFALHVVLGFSAWMLLRWSELNAARASEHQGCGVSGHWAVGVTLLVALGLAASRGGYIIFGVVVVLGMFFARAQRSFAGYGHMRWWTLGGGLVLLITLVLGGGLQRFHQLSFDADRIAIWRSAWVMVEQFPWFGVGGGSFQWVFPYFKQAGLSDKLYVYAHNDYLQLVVEYGIAGLVIAALAVVLIVSWVLQAKTAGKMRSREFAAFWLICSPVALHAAVDFPLHIPAIVMTVVCIIGIALGSTLNCSVRK